MDLQGFVVCAVLPMVKNTGFALFLVLAALAVVSRSESSGAPSDRVPENDYAAFKSQIRKSVKDTSAIRVWFERNLKPMDASNHMFTPEYLRFLGDVGQFNWDGSVTEQQLRRKWGKRFDVDRRVPDHAFETGNCGWGTQKLSKFEYLGQLNGGDWFRLTIKGGCGDNDYSETITRVVKVVSASSRYQIANLIAL
jgi:hypothetical protein